MSDYEELDSGTKGKQGELRVFGLLLERGFSVYSPMVDTGLDCIIDVGNSNYKEIQIKTRTNKSLFQIKEIRPRDNLFIICYLMSKQELWVFPSKVFVENSTLIKRKEGRNYLRITMGKEGSATYEKFRLYRDNFTQLLKGASNEVENKVKRSSSRIEGEHFTQPQFEKEILNILAESPEPLSSAKIVEKLHIKFNSIFTKADIETLSGGRIRWEATARFAIYQGLKKKGLIEAKKKNQWTITQKGIEYMLG